MQANPLSQSAEVASSACLHFQQPLSSALSLASFDPLLLTPNDPVAGRTEAGREARQAPPLLLPLPAPGRSLDAFSAVRFARHNAIAAMLYLRRTAHPSLHAPAAAGAGATGLPTGLAAAAVTPEAQLTASAGGADPREPSLKLLLDGLESARSALGRPLLSVSAEGYPVNPAAAMPLVLAALECSLLQDTLVGLCNAEADPLVGLEQQNNSLQKQQHRDGNRQHQIHNLFGSSGLGGEDSLLASCHDATCSLLWELPPWLGVLRACHVAQPQHAEAASVLRLHLARHARLGGNLRLASRLLSGSVAAPAEQQVWRDDVRGELGMWKVIEACELAHADGRQLDAVKGTWSVCGPAMVDMPSAAAASTALASASVSAMAAVHLTPKCNPLAAHACLKLASWLLPIGSFSHGGGGTSGKGQLAALDWLLASTANGSALVLPPPLLSHGVLSQQHAVSMAAGWSVKDSIRTIHSIPPNLSPESDPATRSDPARPDVLSVAGAAVWAAVGARSEMPQAWLAYAQWLDCMADTRMPRHAATLAADVAQGDSTGGEGEGRREEENEEEEQEVDVVAALPASLDDDYSADAAAAVGTTGMGASISGQGAISPPSFHLPDTLSLSPALSPLRAGFGVAAAAPAAAAETAAAATEGVHATSSASEAAPAGLTEGERDTVLCVVTDLLKQLQLANTDAASAAGGASGGGIDADTAASVGASAASATNKAAETAAEEAEAAQASTLTAAQSLAATCLAIMDQLLLLPAPPASPAPPALPSHTLPQPLSVSPSRFKAMGPNGLHVGSREGGLGAVEACGLGGGLDARCMGGVSGASDQVEECVWQELMQQLSVAVVQQITAVPGGGEQLDYCGEDNSRDAAAAAAAAVAGGAAASAVAAVTTPAAAAAVAAAAHQLLATWRAARFRALSTRHLAARAYMRFLQLSGSGWGGSYAGEAGGGGGVCREGGEAGGRSGEDGGRKSRKRSKGSVSGAREHGRGEDTMSRKEGWPQGLERGQKGCEAVGMGGAKQSRWEGRMEEDGGSCGAAVAGGRAVLTCVTMRVVDIIMQHGSHMPPVVAAPVDVGCPHAWQVCLEIGVRAYHGV
ncbi:unnamed protein product [Closterium sp. NIES-54]